MAKKIAKVRALCIGAFLVTVIKNLVETEPAVEFYCETNNLAVFFLIPCSNLGCSWKAVLIWSVR